jgi:hypothetical protein
MLSKHLAKLAIITLTVVCLAAVLNFHLISGGAGGLAMWNKSEAYFFCHIVHKGYYAPYLQYPLIAVMESLGAVALPKESRASLVVIRVTSSGVERHVVKLADRADGGAGSDPSRYTPIEGRIYAIWLI